MYLNILSTTKIKDEKVLLKAAIWEKDVNNKLILVSPDRLPKLPDTDNVKLITPKECDLLKNFDIKCPSSNLTNSSMGKRSIISLHSIKIRLIVGLVCSILLVSIVIAVFYCLYKRHVFKQRIQKKKVWTRNFHDLYIYIKIAITSNTKKSIRLKLNQLYINFTAK